MKLVIPLREELNQEFPLQGRITTIGRSPDNDVLLYDSRVSPDHALIRQERGKFVLYEWDSRQNTWVNEELIDGSQLLQAGDRIRMGNTILFFLEDEARLDPRQVAAAAEEIVSRSLSRIVDASEPQKQAEEMKRSQSIDSLWAFLHEGRRQLGSRSLTQSDFLERLKAEGAYGAFITGPAAILTMIQKLRGKDVKEAFPQGTWQFYTQFGLREDEARHANETLGYHRNVPGDAQEVDVISSWIYQIICTYFEYDALLENEWTERILLRLVDEVIEEEIIESILKERGEKIPDSQTQKIKVQIRRENVEKIERERDKLKRSLNLVNIKSDWIKVRPYKRDRNIVDETYPQYRRRVLLAYFADRIRNLPSTMEDRIWDKYYALLSEKDLDAYQEQMSILYSLKPGKYLEEKEAIPLWKAKVALILKGRYYLIDVCARDEHGNLLLFDPNEREDEGTPLILRVDKNGRLWDESGASVIIDRKGVVRIEEEHHRSGLLRPIPPQELKRKVAEILHHSQQPGPDPSRVDLLLVDAPRAEQANLRGLLDARSRWELEELRKAPVILNWDLQDYNQTLGDIRTNRRGIGDHAMTIFRTDRSFVFDQSHIFFDAIWGIALSQTMTDRAIESYEEFEKIPDIEPRGALDSKQEKRRRDSSYPLHLRSNRRFERAAERYQGREDVSVENRDIDLAKIKQLRRLLKKAGIRITVNDILTLYRSIYDPLYDSEVVSMGLGVQLARPELRREAAIDPKKMEAARLIDETLEEMRSANPSLLIPMDASFVDPKERLFPTTFRNPFV
ncbi:MAG: FHA domain-containing protein, partial [Anaerolineae bacterium]